MDVTLLYFADCPNWQTTEAHLENLRAEYGFNLRKRPIRSVEEAEQVELRGSPTVLIDGVDPYPNPHAPSGLACRLYHGPDGLTGTPTEAMLRAALSGPRRPARKGTGTA